eukprot:1156361-Pelagomonas_calceolata.AAC.1
MGCPPWDRAHKNSVRTTLVLDKGDSFIEKSPVRNIFRERYFQGLLCPVLGAFLYSKRQWQQGMSYVHRIKPSSSGHPD